MRARGAGWGLSAAICLAFASAAPGSSPAGRAPAAPAPIRVIVKLRALGDSTGAAAHQQRQTALARQQIGELAVRTDFTLLRSRSIMPGLQVVDLASQATGELLATSLARLRADPAVEYAELDQRRHIAAVVPTDPLYAPSSGATGEWYLNDPRTTPAAIDAIDAWTTTQGSAGLVIADIDTGVRFDHPDLLRAGAGGRLLPGYSFVSSVLAANDGAAAESAAAGAHATWDADASDPGDWISAIDLQAPEFSSCTIGNSTWHGTRVVGILGAITNNGVGIAGVTWDGWILPVRALGKCGGADSDIETAMEWAAGMPVEDDLGNPIPTNPYPANVINLSLAAPGTCPQSYQTVITQLINAGVTVIAAAGNEGGPVYAPGNCPGVIAVGGLRQDGTKVGFSNLGPEIALSAPAGNCVNTSGSCLYPIDTTTNTGLTTPGPTPASNTYTNQSSYNVGTSFATPMVAGIAGLMLSVNGNLQPSAIRSRLQEGATQPFPVSSDGAVPMCHVPTSATDLQTAECNCTQQTCGIGIANANGAVTAALRPIAAVQATTPISGGQAVTLDASHSAAACGFTISSYQWSVVGGGSINGATTNSTASVTAPSSGSVTVQVVVTDSAQRTDTVQMIVSATAATSSAPADAGRHACLHAISPSVPVTVAVSPSSATVQAGLGSQVFSAALTSTPNQAVSWQVNSIPGGNSSVGTVSSSGVYTPPLNQPTPSTVSVMAVSAQDPSATGFSGVTISPPVAVALSPLSVYIAPGATRSFSAAVFNAGSNTAVVWEVNGVIGGNASVGTISSSGLYSAPLAIPTPATVIVTAVASADATRSDSATVTIAHAQVSVSPSVATVATGASQSFSAVVSSAASSAVIWQVNNITGGNASIGTISSAGSYLAPMAVPTPAQVIITAVSVADPTGSGSAQVTVTAAGASSSSSGASSGAGGGGGGGGGGGAMGWPELLLLAILVVLIASARRARGGERVMMAALLVLLGIGGSAHAESHWVAGVHYFVIDPAQPTGLPPGKVQVTEIFSYACPGCNRFYPVADRLRAALPAYAVMSFLPASFRPDEDWPMFQRAYLTAQQMGIDKRTHDAMFDAVWKTGELAVYDPATQRMRHPPPSIADAAQFYAKAAGIKPEAFMAVTGSFAIDLRIRQADELIRNYGVSETPSIVVNGRYRLNPVSAGGYEQTIELVKWLVAREAGSGGGS